ncbi:translation initiation factor IF-2-like [Melozone crissalis]|uniref:translation initiation factor IF-2-like n=1 Tax=Melozone crissalis TaxID=40204 RepID=UPI0023DA2101|nr:translation initiation factor IF-2-like [Melozone crissalis]
MTAVVAAVALMVGGLCRRSPRREPGAAGAWPRLAALQPPAVTAVTAATSATLPGPQRCVGAPGGTIPGESPAAAGAAGEGAGRQDQQCARSGEAGGGAAASGVPPGATAEPAAPAGLGPLRRPVSAPGQPCPRSSGSAQRGPGTARAGTAQPSPARFGPAQRSCPGSARVPLAGQVRPRSSLRAAPPAGMCPALPPRPAPHKGRWWRGKRVLPELSSLWALHGVNATSAAAAASIAALPSFPPPASPSRLKRANLR